MKIILQKGLQRFIVIFAIVYGNISIAQIPNWNMESWTTTTKDIPSQWLTFGAITKVSPGQNGSYAVKLQGHNSQDYNNGPGAILYGTPGENNNSQFLGGTPYTARPDSMIAYFTYNIAAGDSAWVIVRMTNNGATVSSDLYEYTGSYTSGFKRMAFKIHYYSSATPDTMFIGFTSTIPNGNSINTISWVILDNISFTGTAQNVPNPDFENWTTQSTYSPNGWQVDNSPWGNTVERTTDAYAGSYAMKLQSIYTSQGMIQGYTRTLGPNSNNNNNGNWRPSFPINSTPDFMKGYYKFIPQNGDTFTIDLGLFKNGQQVGSGNYLSPNAINAYTLISIPINYFNTPPISPDSAIIQMATFAMTGNNNHARGQSVAYIDNLTFDQFTTGIVSAGSRINNLCTYPNPAETKVSVRFQLLNKEKVSINIYDLNGYEVMKLTEQYFDSGIHELNFDVDLSSGIYFLNMQSGTSVSHSKLMIAK